MAAVKNLYVDQGSDFNAEITLYDDLNSPWNLASFTNVSAKIKKSYYSTNSVNFTASFGSDRTSGTILLVLSSSQTSSLEQGRYLYDVVITHSDNTKTRVIEGIVTINPGVT